MTTFNIQALREKRQSAYTNLVSLDVANADVAWTDEKQTKYNELSAVVQHLDMQIQAATNILAMKTDQNAAESYLEGTANVARKAGGDAQKKHEQIYENYLRKGDKSLNTADVQEFMNVMSTTTGSEGGFTVPTTVASSVIELLKDFGGMRQVSTVITTSDGAPWQYPRSDGTSEVGELVAENVAVAPADPVFSSVPLNAFNYSSRLIAIPRQLLDDAAVNMVAFLNDRIAMRLARITNQHYTTGSGTGQPLGVFTGAGTGVTGATGSAATFTYAQLVALVESVDAAYHGRASFMMSQAARLVLRNLVDGNSRPIWMPSYEAGLTAGASDILLGKPLIINNQAPAPAANARSIAFGDFSRYIIRDVNQMQVFRLDDSPFIRQYQAGFLAFMRTGGTLTDTTAVKVFAHSAT